MTTHIKPIVPCLRSEYTYAMRTSSVWQIRSQKRTPLGTALERAFGEDLSSSQAFPTLSPLFSFPPQIMKVIPNERQKAPKVDTKIAAQKNVVEAKVQEPISLDEVQKHLEQLRAVSAIAAKLFALLGDQIAIVSSTAPIQRGYKTARSHSAHVPLRR